MNNSYKKNNQGGYTLLMMAMSLMVIGVISVGGLQAYNIYSVKQKLALNEKRVADIIQKVQAYRQLYGRLPCPASLDAARNSAAYGQESNCADVATIATGNCVGGICVVAGARPLVSPRVRIGAIPFRVLQADESEVVDAYNNRMLYAVTETLGVAATYSELAGSIDIRNENAASIINPVGSANFVILSAGE
ncbi:MAG: hypothetical protein AAB276_03260, partial [Pseudomonadota bacterium]